MQTRDPVTLPPLRRGPSIAPPPHPLDPVIEILSEMSLAVRSVSMEVREGMKNMTDAVNTLGGRLDGQSRAAQDLASEIRSFVDDKDRLKGRVIMLEQLEHDRQEANGKADAE